MPGAGSFLRALPLLALLGGCAAPRGYVATWESGYAPGLSSSPAREAEELLRGNEGGLWAVRWEQETYAPGWIANELVSPGAAGRRPKRFDAVAVADAFLRRNAAIFPLRPGLDSLALVSVSTSRAMVTVRVEQRLRGVRVDGGGYSMTLSPDGLVSDVIGRYFPRIEPPASPRISVGDARAIAAEFVGARADSTKPELLIRRWDGQFRLAYSVGVREDMLHHWNVHVDADRGTSSVERTG